MENRHIANIVRLGPRIPVPEADPNAEGIMDWALKIAVPNRVVVPRSAATTSSSSTCAANDNSAQCEKPVGSSAFTLPIILGTVIPICGAAILFFILHRRHLRKQREEDANDRHASLDFGLGDVPQPGRAKRSNKPSDLDFGEKRGRGQRQISMDMTVNSPYLLPPEVHNSRESLHSLSRTINHEDPYRQVGQYIPGDAASLRSYSKHDGSSVYTGSSAAPSRLQDLGTSDLLSNARPMARSTPPTAVIPPRQNSLPQGSLSSNRPGPLSNNPLPPLPLPYPVEPPQVHLQDPPVSAGAQRTGLPSSPRSGNRVTPASIGGVDGRESYASNGEAAIRQSQNYLGAFINALESPTPPSPPSKSSARENLSPPRDGPPPMLNSLPSSPRPARAESIPRDQNPRQSFANDEGEYGEGFKVTPPSPDLGNHAELMRGQRYSMDVPPEEFAQAGLGAAPGFDPRRVSMGFRPLPPDELTDSDDPEVRANRIRSFYREYFDESRPAPRGQYYEDYDENYLGDSTYYDPASNNFVMPYAQPVTRRAMTPPPRGPRFQGPPRAMHGSMGAMSMGGMRRPPMYPPGPYPPGPRAFSSAFGRMGTPGPRRPMPPPAALTSLPTPAMLKDDSFALMNATDFAPPQSFRERVAGRSESPLGERRPYSPSVPSFAPLASAFDELAPMPSPHMLRKSGTFTALDFAPPKKFRDPDTMSDAGSIRSNRSNRSNRSGVSAVQLGAIRSGAYRVSRLPQDMVFSRDDMAATLKPQWGMRVGS